MNLGFSKKVRIAHFGFEAVWFWYDLSTLTGPKKPFLAGTLLRSMSRHELIYLILSFFYTVSDVYVCDRFDVYR